MNAQQSGNARAPARPGTSGLSEWTPGRIRGGSGGVRQSRSFETTAPVSGA